MDFSQLGIDLAAVTVIIATIQTAKNKFFEDLSASVAFIAATLISGFYGLIQSDLSLGFQEVVKSVFSYMAYTSFTYSGAKHMGLQNVLKGQNEINSAKAKDGKS